MSERRALRRYADGSTPVQLRIAPDGEPRPAFVLNFSIEGIGLLTDIDIPRDTPVTLDWMHKPRRLDAVVRHTTPNTEGGWLVGCRLSQILQLEDLKQLD